MGTAATPWTEDRVQTVHSMWTAGFSATQIAERLGGVTRNAVIGQIHRRGWNRNKASAPVIKRHASAPSTKFRWSQDRDNRLAELFVSGADDRDIAAEIGTTVWSIISRRKVLRLLRENKGPGPTARIPKPRDPVPLVTAAWTALPGVEPLVRLDAQSNHCKWPITVEGDELSFCCGSKAAGGPYCATHKLRSIAPKQPADVIKAQRRFIQSHGVMIHGKAA